MRERACKDYIQEQVIFQKITAGILTPQTVLGVTQQILPPDGSAASSLSAEVLLLVHSSYFSVKWDTLLCYQSRKYF